MNIINETLQKIKKAKSDKEIKLIIAQLGSDAQWCTEIGDACTEYAANNENKK